MSTDAAFLRSIEADLADPAPLLIYADWLEEHDMGQVAYAWRWMATRGYRPAKRERPWARLLWAWWHRHSNALEHPQDRLDWSRHPEAQLPPFVFLAMIRNGGLAAHVYCPTLAGAVSRLARGWNCCPSRLG